MMGSERPILLKVNDRDCRISCVHNGSSATVVDNSGGHFSTACHDRINSWPSQLRGISDG